MRASGHPVDSAVDSAGSAGSRRSRDAATARTV